MRLTRHTDYALRVLIYLSVHPAGFAPVSEIAAAFRVSQNHMNKVAQGLATAGFVETTRGRGGGLRLAKPAAAIKVGAVVRRMEETLALAECETCTIVRACGLTGALDAALAAFLAVLDGYTIADVGTHRRLSALLGLEAASGSQART